MEPSKSQLVDLIWALFLCKPSINGISRAYKMFKLQLYFFSAMAVLIYPFFTNSHRRFPKADFISVILSIPTAFDHGLLCIRIFKLPQCCGSRRPPEVTRFVLIEFSRKRFLLATLLIRTVCFSNFPRHDINYYAPVSC